MCSFLVQIVYGVVCFVATAMTITSMVTPGWTTYSFDVKDTITDISQGILPFTCAYPDEKPQAGLVFDWSDCAAWFNNLPWTEKTVVACMCIGLAFQLVAFVWNIISICACCCKKYILHPLSIFTLLAVIFLAIAVAFYAIFNGVDWIDLNSNNPIGVPDLAKGYSFWLACGALVLNVVNMIVASAALCCAKGCC